jgi:hypothetical protein
LAMWITSGASSFAAQPQKAEIEFYGHPVSVPFDASVRLVSGPFSPDVPATFNKAMLATSYQNTVNALLEQHRLLDLNDWLYYQMVKKSVREMYPAAGAANYTLLEWFILAKSGYRVYLMHDNKKPYLFVNTPDELLDVPFFLAKDGRYINLSAINTPDEKSLQRLNQTDLNFNPKGRPFIFSFSEMPSLLGDETITRTLRFEHQGQVYSLPVEGNKAYISFLRSYPKLDLEYLPALPVSAHAYNSVIHRFREWTEGMNEAEAVRLILSFTRSAFAYETDREAYDEESFAFNPEMTLLSPFSDCEDRAILFAWLVKEVIGRESVLIEFPTHVAAAVNLETTRGTPISLEGKEYSFCEATGPQDELDIGECDRRYAGVKYKVVRLD